MHKAKLNGYTLVEVMVAMAIFAILVVPVSSLITSNIENNKKAKDNVEFANVVNYAFESYKNNEPVENYMGYHIEYDLTEKTKYELAGIKYDNYDLKLELKDNQLNIKYREYINGNILYHNSTPVQITQDKVTLKLKVNKINENFEYIFNSDEANKILVKKPSGLISLILDNSQNKEISLLVDGIYNGNKIEEKIINFTYFKTQSDNTIINLASVYPNVSCEEKEIKGYESEQKVIELTIIIKKDGKEMKRQTFDVSNILK